MEVRKEFTETGFQVATSQLMLKRAVASYTLVHSNSLIQNLIPSEDDAEIDLLNFLMKSICKQKQPEDTFIKTLEFTELTAIFIASLMEKNLFS